MSKESEWERSQDSSAAFFTGLLAGALIGAGFGVLFAPRRGVELRRQVSDSAASAGQAVSKTVDGWAERGREVYDRARDVASRASEEVDRVAAGTARTVESAFNTASEKAAGAARRAEQHATGRA